MSFFADQRKRAYVCKTCGAASESTSRNAVYCKQCSEQRSHRAKSRQSDSEMVIVQLPLEAWLQIAQWARKHPSDCSAHGDGLADAIRNAEYLLASWFRRVQS